MKITLYCARWVLPVEAEAIEDGCVAVEGSLIKALGTRAALIEKYPEGLLEDFGEAAILPGFVNAHSHLELTAMRGFLEREEGDFTAWLAKLTLARLNRMTPDDLYVSAAWGAAEAARSGVTTLADASDAGLASLRALRDVGLRGVVHQESFGPDPRMARENFEILREKVGALREFETGLARAGISPHAVYTVSAPQLELLTAFALDESLPMMMHAAESEAEEMLVREGAGPFARNLSARGIEWRAPRVSVIEYLETLGVLKAQPLLAHCIRTDEADMERIVKAGAGIAHCPKSNAKLGHGRAPFAGFINSGARVGLGSDSVASNNLCDMLEEARFAALNSRAGGDRLDSGAMTGAGEALRAATSGGARAVRLDALTGELSEGLQADLVVVNLNATHQLPVYDAESALVFSSSARDVLLTVVAGREVFREGRVLTIDEERLGARIREIQEKLSAA
ncbi:MAG TPA: amidohydrolase family protein [Pyrinomonadaceae bacterium]|nr:amidohydrolase family protein [Pyrinomonadaceae bacterium]